MTIVSSLQLAFVAALISYPFASAQINKPALFPQWNTYLDKVNGAYWDYLKPTPSHSEQWGWGWIPSRCLEEAQSNGVNPYDIEVFNVWYDDCPISHWIMCRHHKAPTTQIEMIDLFGRMPVAARQWVQHVMAFEFVPEKNGPGAYAYKTSITLLQHSTPHQMAHEIFHVVDIEANGQTGGRFSDRQGFRDAVARDSCVASPYAQTDYGEDWSETSALNMYEIIHPRGLDALGVQWRCLQNQKGFIESVQRSAMTPGGICQRRWPTSPVVSMGPATGNGRLRLGPRPNTGPAPGSNGVSAQQPKDGPKLITNATPSF